MRTQFGFHIIKLTDRKPAHTATLDEAREQIETYLRDEKRRAAVTRLVQSLRQTVHVKSSCPERIARPQTRFSKSIHPTEDDDSA